MAEASSALGMAPPIDAVGLAAAEVPHLAKVTVRGRDAGPVLVQAVTAALGVAPPLIANTTTRLAARTVLWLGPGEWRVVGPPGDAAALVEALRSELPRRLPGVVDVSGFSTTLGLRGGGARAGLAQGRPPHLPPRPLGP